VTINKDTLFKSLQRLEMVLLPK